LGPVPTYRVNKHKDRRNIRHQTADRRQTASINRKRIIEISKQKKRKRLLVRLFFDCLFAYKVLVGEG
jgi:hypothetical protein